MKLNQKTLKELLLNGVEFNWGRVFICSLEGKNPTRCEWQVHSDDHRFLFSAMYYPEELDAAIDKFCVIVSQIQERANAKLKSTKKDGARV